MSCLPYVSFPAKSNFRSILLFYRRIFGFQSKIFRLTVYGLIAYVTCWFLASFFATLFVCWPISYVWTQTDPTVKGFCRIKYLSMQTMQVSTNILSTLNDVALVILPIVMLWKLQMALPRKLEIIAIFSVGAL